MLSSSMSVQDLTNYYLNGNIIPTERVNEECPICLEKFKINEELVYGCEAKHLHHASCFQEMIQKNSYTCASCRKDSNVKSVRLCRPCSCMDEDLTTFDQNTNDTVWMIPTGWCLGNICCPFFCLFAYPCLIYQTCCTKEILKSDESVVTGLLSNRIE